MCFDHDARPPELPADLRRIAGAAPGERLDLRSADGTTFAAFLSQPPGEARAGIVILPDVRGLYRFYEDLAERFAAAGLPAVTLDYFGRTAGAEARDDDFDYWPHVTQTTPEQVQTDAVAARDALRERAGDVPAVSVGFCFGGYQSFLAATSAELGLAGAVGFYGSLGDRFGASPIDRAGALAFVERVAAR